MNVIFKNSIQRYFNIVDDLGRNRLQNLIIAMSVIIPGLALTYDLYESISHGYMLMSIVEITTMLSIGIFYLYYPRYINFIVMTNIMLAAYSIFLFLSFFIPDHNAEYSIFWIGSLPIVAFFFLGRKQGIRWTILIVVVGFILWFLSLRGILDPIISPSLMLQIISAFLGVSLIAYILEKERSIYVDISQRTLEKNKLLFKEVHHRTKNNMQIMMGLLETQSFKIEDEFYKKMFQNHVDRLKAMSLVHENLYSGNSYSAVNMQHYLGSVVDNFRALSEHKIVIDIDSVTLDMKSAMDLGLIVNELLSNAIEHAYQDEKGEIIISFKLKGSECTLIIEDYGKGFQLDESQHSLGMTLIQDLAYSLNDGMIEFDTTKGTKIIITCILGGKQP